MILTIVPADVMTAMIAIAMMKTATATVMMEIVNVMMKTANAIRRTNNGENMLEYRFINLKP